MESHSFKDRDGSTVDGSRPALTRLCIHRNRTSAAGSKFHNSCFQSAMSIVNKQANENYHQSRLSKTSEVKLVEASEALRPIGMRPAAVKVRWWKEQREGRGFNEEP
ncbi:hypothetical protein E2C01_053534 [Portunus trituberculatus]|uniref:Uncharacterized protein n=1 Tax=Portunus trituberculatus TaxID=210409 RepID=A0A5B7GHD1_PORTR|nr:hypothetical protein [Portunus trituberculatus]